jgi:hypothetical protein
MPRLLIMALALTLGSTVEPSPVTAQSEGWVAVGPTAGWSELRLDGFEPLQLELSGVSYGGELAVAWWRLVGTATYRQGWLSRGDSGDERVAEGGGALGVRPWPWLTVQGELMVWNVGTLTGDETVQRWRAGLRGETPMIEDAITAFVDLKMSIAGDRMTWDEFPGGEGDVGLLVRVPGHPVWGKLGFRLSREVLSGGGSLTRELTYVSIGLSTAGFTASPASR